MNVHSLSRFKSIKRFRWEKSFDDLNCVQHLLSIPGTACAWSLSRSPEKFDVHLWEALPVPGGVASSCKVKDGECPDSVVSVLFYCSREQCSPGCFQPVFSVRQLTN